MTLREFVDLLKREGVDLVDEEIEGTQLVVRTARFNGRISVLPMVDGGENIEWSVAQAVGRHLGFPDGWPLKSLR